MRQLYQAKLQQNLKYLAAIADAQLGIPFLPPMQPPQHYTQQLQVAAQKHITEVPAVPPQPTTDDPEGNVGLI
ncbi:uncharacterized protein [Physcomitrium patens]|uniref:Uncharacterized protein n=1 Tax=Physcomitrium patens TaxID=3218 RepID=A0A2K1KPG4_PHYPA|nr:hypothetical protein PHYPA_006570 [Physcomitrium patens]